MKNSLIIIALISLVLNLYIASRAGLVSDTSNFYRVGEAVVNFNNPYINLKDAYPYPPISMFISGLNYKISQITGLSFPFINRIIPIFSFISLGIVIFNNILKEYNLRSVMLYFFNPLIILVTTIVGQNDILVILLVILSLFSFNKKPFFSGSLFALSSLIKIYPLFILPLLIIRSNNKKIINKFLIVFISINIAFWIPFFLLSFKDTLVSAFFYKGFSDFGWGGVTRTLLLILGKDFISSLLFTQKLSKIGLILFSGFYLVSFNKLIKMKDLFKKSSIIFTSFLVLYPNISVQYLIWVLPFYFLYQQRDVIIKYSILATLCGLYFFLFSNPSLLGIDYINTSLQILLILQVIIYFYTFRLLVKDCGIFK